MNPHVLGHQTKPKPSHPGLFVSSATKPYTSSAQAVHVNVLGHCHQPPSRPPFLPKSSTSSASTATKLSALAGIYLNSHKRARTKPSISSAHRPRPLSSTTNPSTSFAQAPPSRPCPQPSRPHVHILPLPKSFVHVLGYYPQSPSPPSHPHHLPKPKAASITSSAVCIHVLCMHPLTVTARLTVTHFTHHSLPSRCPRLAGSGSGGHQAIHIRCPSCPRPLSPLASTNFGTVRHHRGGRWQGAERMSLSFLVIRSKLFAWDLSQLPLPAPHCLFDVVNPLSCLPWDLRSFVISAVLNVAVASSSHDR